MKVSLATPDMDTRDCEVLNAAWAALYKAACKAKPILGAAAAGSTNEARDLRTRIYDELQAAITGVEL